MVDHHKSTAPTQQVLCGPHELGQRYSEFMPGNGLLRVGIEAPVAHSTIGRIAHHSTEHARGKKRRDLADVALDNADAMLQAIAGDILMRRDYPRGLQRHPPEPGLP